MGEVWFFLPVFVKSSVGEEKGGGGEKGVREREKEKPEWISEGRRKEEERKEREGEKEK